MPKFITISCCGDTDKLKSILTCVPYDDLRCRETSWRGTVVVGGTLYDLVLYDKPSFHIRIDVVACCYVISDNLKLKSEGQGIPYCHLGFRKENQIHWSSSKLIEAVKKLDAVCIEGPSPNKVAQPAFDVLVNKALQPVYVDIMKFESYENKKLNVFHADQWKKLQNCAEVDLSYNLLKDLSALDIEMQATTLNLYNNMLSDISALRYFCMLTSCNLAHNYLLSLPSGMLDSMPLLKELNVEHNLLENIPTDLSTLNVLSVEDNPLSEILPVYRDNSKILEFLRACREDLEPNAQWDQIKLMIVGQEGVGKTSLMRKLQDKKYQCDTNISTNGVEISTLTLPRSFSWLSFQKDPGIHFNVWDFGGQAVFHSTHRLFITSNAIYAVLYDMTKPETILRLKYWIEQVASTNSDERSKPILIIGTHADQLTKQDQAKINEEVKLLYPSNTSPHSRLQIYGHFTLSVTSGSLQELREKLVDIALNHHKIGIGKVKVPRRLAQLQKKLQEYKDRGYLSWSQYSEVAVTVGITVPDFLRNMTTILHDSGIVVWHNMAKLRDLVVIDPQWLAHAMSSVVTFITQSAVTKNRGMANWSKLQEPLKLRFPKDQMRSIILSLLENFEIVFKMRMGTSSTVNSDEPDNEQMLFIPSLLSQFGDSDLADPSVVFWHQVPFRATLVRQFSWNFYPAGFFPRLLLRLVHLRVQLLSSWIDAAVIMSSYSGDCAKLKLYRSTSDGLYHLEVKVKTGMGEGKESLIAELSYIISRLHRDMYVSARTDIPLLHDVITTIKTKELETKEIIIPFATCVHAQIEGKAYLEEEEAHIKVDEIVPDLSSCSLIDAHNIRIEQELGEGGFGKVYKAKMLQPEGFKFVAVKEMRLKGEIDAIYDFRHEIAIMKNLKHENLVGLHGIVQSPLQMVLEFVPMSDLHHVLADKNKHTSIKWRLKVALDCASGMRYLHSQSPPICHSDLRSPNILIASLREDADVVAKVADFGLSQQVFPHAQRVLHNIIETAPETWGDSGYYDERSDVFSFAVILWRLFGAKSLYSQQADEEEELSFLKEEGRIAPPPRQREIIRKGGRLAFHGECPSFIASLTQLCWQTLPELRPSFDKIFSLLVKCYIETYSEDEYILQKQKTSAIAPESAMDVMYLPEFNKASFSAEGWRTTDFPEETSVVSIAEINSDIWLGTSTSKLIMLDAKTRQNLRTVEFQSENSQIRGIRILHTTNHCVWIANESTIHIFSSQLRQEITSILNNNNPIIEMILLPGFFVWISDITGFISIWDAQTLQKCHRVQIHQANCAQSMALMNQYVWMAVGRDIVAMHSQSMKKISLVGAHDDRIHKIVATPNNQVWACARDGTVRVWKLEEEKGKEPLILKVYEWKTSSPVKAACMMADGLHLCTGSFDGAICMWNTENFQRIQISSPKLQKKKSIQSMLDTDDFFWCTIENTTQALQCHPHIHQKVRYSRQSCYTHKSSHHDFFLNYRVNTEGPSSLLAPVKTIFETFSAQKKKRSKKPVLVFWDSRCLNIGQNWEKGFMQGLSYSRMLILLISVEALKGIKNNASEHQDNVLLEYECAILQNKAKGTRVVPLFLAGAMKDETNGTISFSPFDFKELDGSRFPQVAHARSKDAQHIINDLSSRLPPRETEFLKSIGSTIDQIRKLQGYCLQKRGADKNELDQFVSRMMEELESE